MVVRVNVDMKTVRKIIFGVCITVCLLVIPGCSKNNAELSEKVNNGEASRELFAMDTIMTITAYGEKSSEAVDAAAAEVKRLDDLLSTGNAKSEVSILNKNGNCLLSADTGFLLEKSLELYENTEGSFDITIYPLMKEWGFTSDKYKVPSDERINELLKNVDSSLIQWNPENRLALLPDKVEIDFGGIAKGYTSSRIMQIFKKYHVTGGIVSLGGNVQAYGRKNDGNTWKIAVENPDTSPLDGDYAGILTLTDKAVITSGGYERYFEKDGKKYHHIIDPATGKPARSGLVSVTIVSDDGTLADGLSTSLFVMGGERAKEYWKKHSAEFDFILIYEDKTVEVSEGIKDSFSSDFDYEVIGK